MRRWGGIWVVVWTGLAGAVMADDACTDADLRHYPVSEVIRTEAVILRVLEYALVDWEEIYASGAFTPDGTAYRAMVLQRIEGMRAEEADLTLLGLLEEEAGRGDSMVTLTTFSASSIMDEFADVAERHGLETQAEVIRAAKAAYPAWDVSPAQRRLQWTDGQGTITNPALLARLKALSEQYHQAEPSLMEAALAIIKGDAELSERYEAKRQAASDQDRLGYLLRRLWDCHDGNWWKPGEADAVFGPIPEARRDLMQLDLFIAESMNGSVHQYFYNSSGTMAPQLAEILDRHGLSDHAAGIRAGMAEYAKPYPRDKEDRRAQMQEFSEAQDNALYTLTVWADDGAVLVLMPGIAKAAGIWPD